MYFFLSVAQENPEKAPLLIWLQGRPGGSSLFGLFFENGPYSLDKQFRLVPRNVSGTNEHHVLYFDNPVGTGGCSLRYAKLITQLPNTENHAH